MESCRLTERIDAWYFPCAFLRDEGMAVISDLHLGTETYLHRMGISIPRKHGRLVAERVMEMLDRLSPETVVVNGDIKHEFSRMASRDMRDLRCLLDRMLDRTEVRIVRGNHDNYVLTLAARMGIPLTPHVETECAYITHGGSTPPSIPTDRTVILAHEHPAVMLRDAIGAGIKVPCFLYSDDVIVLPAFSPFAAGSNVCSLRFRSPILKGLPAEMLNVCAVHEGSLLPLGPLRHLA